MNQSELVKEIIRFCKYFKVIEMDIEDSYFTKEITDNLNDVIFVENLLNVFYRAMKLKQFRSALNKQRLKNLLLELENIRLSLEITDL